MKYNTRQYNVAKYNGGMVIITPPTSDQIVSFRGYGLQNSNIITSRMRGKLIKDIKADRKPNSDGRIVLGDYYDNYDIVLEGRLRVDSAGSLDSLVDEFRKNISVPNGNLDIILDNGIKRRWLCHKVDEQIGRRDEPYHITTCPFRVAFKCYNPFGQALTYDANTYDVATLGFSEVLENNGTAKGKPIWILLINAASGITGINIKNNSTDEEIEITETIQAGDSVEFNGETLQVLLNSVGVEWSGKFPHLQPGSNSYSVTVSGASIDYTITEKNKSLFL